MRKVLGTAFFTSALAPAVLVIAAKSIWNLGPTLEAVCWLTSGAIACAFPLIIIRAVAQRAESVPVQIKKVEPLEWPMMAAVVAYLIPLIVKEPSFSQVAVIVTVAGALLAAIDAVPFHPVLHIFRYRFYKADLNNNVTYWLIVRGRIQDPSRIARVKEVTPGLIMEDA